MWRLQVSRKSAKIDVWVINTSDGDYVNLLACIETEPSRCKCCCRVPRHHRGTERKQFALNQVNHRDSAFDQDYWGHQMTCVLALHSRNTRTPPGRHFGLERRSGACLRTHSRKIWTEDFQIQLDENVNNNVDIRFDVAWSGLTRPTSARRKLSSM